MAWHKQKVLTIDDFQTAVAVWVVNTLGQAISMDRQERNWRFLEESVELVQSLGMTAEDAHKMVDYVYNRPVGDPTQEIGGVMVTLAALCRAASLSIDDCCQEELARISTKESMDKLRAKQGRRIHRSPLSVK